MFKIITTISLWVKAELHINPMTNIVLNCQIYLRSDDIQRPCVFLRSLFQYSAAFWWNPSAPTCRKPYWWCYLMGKLTTLTV